MIWIALLYSVLVCTLALVLHSILVRKRNSARKGRFPPSPKGLPVVGHLPLMKNGFPDAVCAEWGKKCGPIFSIKFGFTDVVVLNDLESVKTIMSKKEVLHRPENTVFHNEKISGLASMNGEAWIQNRRASLRVLKDLGFGQKRMEDNIMEEAQRFVKRLAKTNGTAIVVSKVIAESVCDNIWRVLFGNCGITEDPRRKTMVQSLEKFQKAMGVGTMVDVLPRWLMKLFMMLPFSRNVAIQKSLRTLIELTSGIIKEHEDTADRHGKSNFIYGYMAQMEERKNDPASTLNRDNLVGNALTLFMAASHSVTACLRWHMLNFAQSVETIQARIHEEIDRVVGRERQPAWEDRLQMPYTMAVILEMYRCMPVLNLPRSVEEDSYFGNYFIPKRTVVMPNFWAVHMSPTLWKDPETFDPTRFLTEDGSKLVDKQEQLISFSVGKRMCPGKPLAEVQIFVYLTTVLQKFKVLPDEGHPFSINYKNASATDLMDQKLRFIPRWKLA